MFVKEFGQVSAAELNQQLDKVYKWKLDLKKINENDASSMLKTLGNKIKNIRGTSQAHHAERNPQYMEAVMVSKVLESWKNEMAHNRQVIAEHYRAIDEYCSITLNERELSPSELKKREHYAKALKGKKGDFEKRYGKRGEEVMYATATKMAKNESIDLPPSLPSFIIEGEIEQARVTMAARDLADTVQDIVEKISKMQNEQLPALVSAMKDQVGIDQANQFNQSTGGTLQQLLDAANTARDALDNASRGVYSGGETMGAPTDADINTAGMGDDLNSPIGGDEAITPPTGAESDLNAADSAVGGPEEFGRGRR
jgi:hypothetical protein